MNALDMVYEPLRRQLRGLSVALRGGSTERAREHARDAVSLVNEATDLSLTADDLLLALAEGARMGSTGADVIERLLELGVQRQLQATGALVIDEGTARFTQDGDELRRAVHRLLGSRASLIDRDPRWARLLAGGETA